ncbi:MULTISPECIES: metal ABC transporter ATP-binding protein [unclassified Saccharopolyspora]|uniref:metal ABC transporter ATP-binding protein n=1 Tax=unclassified Saccharopolyspora TaxID=2646250 RepID=UPI001CD4F4E7|nr:MULTISPECIES: metal ABC transporter ATP-binding protein [unclassified Saccharopolyspora]MCA1187503.1 metal ABC transporter ATP-binding protein [Saccharopolyspora sp. 6T]MCA1194731.1 metal ABC transporter ATP-binding protein [Saccharopolyspora sp. 6V]MCA1228204.1 metal ABC transporter ATP-binding protein [Saccharopolyspora sp. 6M]MCA1280580.1 metal ABC transporter ATP-binding protein [Saccharopolyspora sp. 7B]
MSVQARHVTVSYREALALDDVSVDIASGQVCGLLGVNGSGKSTLFKALMGLVRPDRGEIRLLGRDPKRARRDGLVAYVPQSEAIDATFPVTVADVVLMGRYGRMGITRRARPADRAAVAEALDRVGLTDLARNPIGALSGGQRKRAFVARGIAQGAELLLLDEPFAGVDKGSEAMIADLLRGLRDEGRTIMISTHDLAGAPALCDEAVLLHQRVLAHGPVDDVLAPEVLARTFGVPGGVR